MDQTALIGIDNYSPVGDVAVIAMCVSIVIMLLTSYVSRTRSFHIFMGIVALLALAAMANIFYHALLDIGNPDYYSLVYVLRIVYQAMLFNILFLFALYATVVSGLEHRKARYVAIGATVLLIAIVVLDINDLKKVNDTNGHQAGDNHLRNACRVICEAFKHSPVFRVGGDEFAVIAQASDYAHIEERLWDVSVHNEEALRSGGVVIACGMAKFENDDCVAVVFDRADRHMYHEKETLKSQVTGDAPV